MTSCTGIFFTCSFLLAFVQAQDNWSSRSGYEYYFSGATEKKNWDDARQVCLNAQGDLASVHSQQEHDWIQDKRRNSDYWIGLHNPNAKGKDDDGWAWSDGSPKNWVKWENNEFSQDEPNNWGEACVHYGYERFEIGEENWYDDECSESKRYICKRDINECEMTENACHNNGSCNNTKGDFVCICKPGFEGKLCQTVITECSSLACLNNAECEETASSFICHCDSGYTGQFCETAIELEENDACVSDPCKNEGQCLDAESGFSCECKPGFTGSLCEQQSGKRSDKKEAGFAYMPIVIGCLVAVLCLIIILVIVFIIVRRRRRNPHSKLKKDPVTELDAINSQQPGGSNFTRNESQVVSTENELYEPSESPTRYPKGSVLYTAPNKWGGGEVNANLKHHELQNKESDSLYEKEQPVFKFDQDDVSNSDQTGSRERLMSGDSLYAKEQPRNPSTVSLYSKDEQSKGPDSNYYDVPIPVVQPKAESNTPKSQQKGSIYSKEQPVLQPPIGGQQSMYAREHYRASEGHREDESEPARNDAVYVNQGDVRPENVDSSQNEYNLEEATGNTQNEDAYSLSEGATLDRNDVTANDVTADDVQPNDITTHGPEPNVYTYADHNFTPAVIRTTSHPSSTLSSQGSMSAGEYSPTYMPMGTPDRTSPPKLQSPKPEAVYANFNNTTTESAM